MKRKFYIISLGCPRNMVDSEVLITRLKDKDYRLVDDLDNADVAIVNTCAFIKEAKEESIDVILDLIRLKKEGRLNKILVYGCLPERYGTALTKHLKGVDAFSGRTLLDSDCEAPRYRLTPPHYAYVKICEGCVNNCSYCVIPKIKGPLKSSTIDSILKEVAILDRQKTSEVILIGQDISAFGSDLDKKNNLAILLKKIVKNIKNIKWLRLLYLHPAHIDNDLLDIIAAENSICKYVDLPIQHINDKILKLMQRKTTKEEILNLIEKVRRKIPGVTIRTSLIVGFPQETESAFKELLDFVRQAEFQRLGVFIYSREEGTPAYNFKNQIPFAKRKARFDALMSLQQEISRKNNGRLLNKEIEVLIDEQQDKSTYLARSQADAPEVDGNIFVRSARVIKPGEFVRVKIVDTYEYDLVGEEIG